jgi:hypothetical protein
MSKIFMALILGTVLWPAVAFAHDPYYRNYYWRDRVERRIARPGDPGFYCHRHSPRLYRHCHSIYNDPHRVVADRSYPYPRYRRWYNH